jgi:hypothetical protein
MTKTTNGVLLVHCATRACAVHQSKTSYQMSVSVWARPRNRTDTITYFLTSVLHSRSNSLINWFCFSYKRTFLTSGLANRRGRLFTSTAESDAREWKIIINTFSLCQIVRCPRNAWRNGLYKNLKDYRCTRNRYAEWIIFKHECFFFFFFIKFNIIIYCPVIYL